MVSHIVSYHKGFEEAILYIFKPEKRPEIISSNEVYSTDKEDIITEFLVQRNHNQKARNWWHHISLSFSPKDHITNESLQMYVQEFFQQIKTESKKHNSKNPIDFSDCQYIAVQHKDKKHKHIHLIINRVQITPNFKNKYVLTRDSNIKLNATSSSYAIAKKHNLELDKIKNSKIEKVKNPSNLKYKSLYHTANREKFISLPKKNTILRLDNYDILYKSLSEKNIDDFFDTLERSTKMTFQIKSSRTTYLEALKNNTVQYKSHKIDEMFSYLNLKTKFKIDDFAIKTALKKHNQKQNLYRPSLRQEIKSSENIEDLENKLATYKLRLVPSYLKEEKIKLDDIKNYYVQRQKLNPHSQPYYLFETYENEKEKLSEQINKTLLLIENNSLKRFKDYLKMTFQVNVVFKTDNNNKVVNVVFSNENNVQFKGSSLSYKFSGAKINSMLESNALSKSNKLKF